MGLLWKRRLLKCCVSWNLGSKAADVNDNSHVFSYAHILAVLSLNLTGSLCNLWGMLRLWGCRVRYLVHLAIAPFFFLRSRLKFRSGRNNVLESNLFCDAPEDHVQYLAKWAAETKAYVEKELLQCLFFFMDPVWKAGGLKRVGFETGRLKKSFLETAVF